MTSHAQLERDVATIPAPFYRRIWFLLTVFLTLLLLALLPPYLNMSRLQRRITTSISASLGRPVHFDTLTLNLLPFPSFTIDNFVVSEDPAFGYEPTIRSNSVTARLRVSTLWRRRIEISRITFTDPSVNIVHTSDGRWNLDSILLQAAHIPSAPTAQPTAGPTPRFPYIEATGARLNLKLDNHKTPYALTEADFALWLPSPEVWHFRIAARPARTDIPAGYSGMLRLDGTLGRAPSLTQIPLDLHLEWRTAPLGEVSRILLGSDADWRGDMTLIASILGTVGSNTLHTTLHLADLHRAAFVPPHLLDLSVECAANITSALTAMPKLECTVPAASTTPTFQLTGSIGDLRRPTPTSLHAELAPIPASTLVPIFQTFSARTPPNLTLGGALSGTFTCTEAPCDQDHITATFKIKDLSLSANPEEKKPILIGDSTLQTTPAAGVPAKSTTPQPAANAPTLTLVPTTISLGAREPVQLDGHLDRTGFSLHLSGNAIPTQLDALRDALPQLAEGFPGQVAGSNPVRLDYTLTHTWTGNQTWQQDAPHPFPAGHPTKLHHR